MTSEIEVGNKRQQMATVLGLPQRAALELLPPGFSDLEIAQKIGVRRKTIWKWKHRDVAFQAEIKVRKATMMDEAAERLRGAMDHAVPTVMKSVRRRVAGESSG